MKIKFNSNDFRTDTESLFKTSGCFNGLNKHSNILVISPSGKISIPSSAHDIPLLEDDTEIIVRWPGQWRSDCFHFKAKDYKEYLQKAKQ